MPDPYSDYKREIEQARLAAEREKPKNLVKNVKNKRDSRLSEKSKSY